MLPVKNVTSLSAVIAYFLRLPLATTCHFRDVIFAKPFIANKFVRDVCSFIYYQQNREQIVVFELFNMSMKENLMFWAEAVERADDKDNPGALERFSFITEPSARIYYNMAAIYLRQRNINQAETVRSTELIVCENIDNYLW